MSQMDWSIIRNAYHASDPLRCGERHYPRAQVENGFTPQYALVYLSSGALIYSDPEHAGIEVQTGDAFQRFPERPHRLQISAGTRSHYIAVPAAVLELMRSLGVRSADNARLRIGVQSWILQRHRQVLHELRRSPPQRLMGVLCRMQQLLVDLHLHAASREVAPGAVRRIDEACALLSQDPNERSPLSTVATRVGLSYANFRKLFRTVTGLAPGDYRIRRRIDRAQELLLQGCSPTEVARALGYPDLFTFSAQFKRCCGLSPRRFARTQA